MNRLNPKRRGSSDLERWLSDKANQDAAKEATWRKQREEYDEEQEHYLDLVFGFDPWFDKD